MKVLLTRISLLAVAVTMLAVCRNVVYVPQIPPVAKAKLMDYHKMPENKVFVIAIDPGGEFSFGYDYGKPSLKAAARVAVEKCDANREAHGICAAPIVYAINDKVVYEEMLRKAHEIKKAKKQREAQIDAVGQKEAAQ